MLGQSHLSRQASDRKDGLVRRSSTAHLDKRASDDETEFPDHIYIYICVCVVANFFFICIFTIVVPPVCCMLLQPMVPAVFHISVFKL